MSAEPAILRARAPSVPLPTAAALPQPAVEGVTWLPLDSVETRDLLSARGPMYRSWLEYWESLGEDERDPLTHPAWLSGHLLGIRSTEGHGAVRLAMFHGGGRILSVLPVERGRGGGVRHASGFDCKSLALAARDRSTALGSVLGSRAVGPRPRCLLLASVDETHGLLDARWPQIANPVWFRSLIELEGGYETMLARLGSKARNNVRRLRKRLAKAHDIEFVALSDAADLEAGFERFLEVDARSWKRDDGSVLRADTRQRRCLRASLNAMSSEGRAVVHILRADGTDIAAQLGCVVNRQLQVIKTSYDAGWANYGAGKLLLDESMRLWCGEHDIVGLNLVTGLDWHLQWQPRRIVTYAVWLLAPGARGAFARCLDVSPRDVGKDLLRRHGLEARARALVQRLRR